MISLELHVHRSIATFILVIYQMIRYVEIDDGIDGSEDNFMS